MGAIKEVQEFWESLPKYSLVKMIIYLLLFFVTAFIVVVFWKAIAGEYVKVLGIEINVKESKSDTIKPNKNTPLLFKSINKPVKKDTPIFIKRERKTLGIIPKKLDPQMKQSKVIYMLNLKHP